MNLHLKFGAPVLLAALVAALGCESGSADGGDGFGGSGGGSGDTARGGPDSLVGITWNGPASTVNGISLQPALEFGPDSVTVLNTCDRNETVSATAPVRYHYTAVVQSAATGGDESCFVSIAEGSFAFEIDQGALIMKYGDQVLQFAAAGPVAGLFGDWSVSMDGLTLNWSFATGKIRAQAECQGGASAAAEAPASFKNFITIETAAAEDSGTCEAGIQAGTFEYWFDGDDIVMLFGGQEIRFSSGRR